MPHLDWSQHLQACPLLLAGPLLRHTAVESISVWVALKRACLVDLTIYTTTNQGSRLGEPQMAGQTRTIRLGQHLHLAVVTAQPLITSLQSDRLYAYDLRFTPQDGHPSQSLLQALGPGQSISYFGHQRPTFALPPSHLDHLKIVHGSCRKPHNEGYDALSTLDRLTEQAAASPYHRPHQMFHSGDQLYSDDVADAMLAMCTPFGEALLGWREVLPVGRRVGAVEGAEEDRASYCTAADMAPGERADIATHTAGFTGGLRQKRSHVTSHLFGFGEFCALYLLSWSPSCWPARLPQPPADAAPPWHRDSRLLRQFHHTLWRVRRVLANVANYMIFDDHDVSDDWNLNKAWCLRVLGKPLGRRAVQNAIHTYGLFQGWGNAPAKFTPDQPAHRLLALTEAWSDSEGKDTAACEQIGRYLGLPRCDRQTGLPKFTPAGDGLICLEHAPEAIPWHVLVESHNHAVIMLDTRMWRAFPAEGSPIAPPQLLSPKAFEQQLTRPLQRCEAREVTLVVAPTNMFHTKILDWVHDWKLKNKQVFDADVGDAWTVNMEALAQLLKTLFNQRRQVVILSGDIHYSASMRLTYQSKSATKTLVQLTCSSLKNEELQTRLVHSRLKPWLLPERDRRWVGWDRPRTMFELPSGLIERLFSAKPPVERPHDWACRLEWLPWQTPGRVNVPLDGLIRPGSAGHERSGWVNRLKRAGDRLLRARWFQNGNEMVGINNIGLVRFTTSEAEPKPWAIAPEAGGLTVTHQVYWVSPWQPQELLCSQCAIVLPPECDERCETYPDSAPALNPR